MKLKMRPAHLILTVLIQQSLIEIIVKKTTYQMIIKLCNTITLKILIMT